MGKANKRIKLDKNDKQASQGKVVGVNDLNWKDVKINKSIDLVEGFFGLEEIDGVDIQYVDGKAQFVVRDEAAIRKQDESNEKVKVNKSLVSAEDEAELEKVQQGKQEKQEEEESEEEFTGFSDREDEAENEASERSNGSSGILTTDLLDELEDDGDSADDRDLAEMLEDYESNLQENKLNSIIEDDEEINSVVFEPDFVQNWGDLGLSKYTLYSLHRLNFSKPTDIQKACLPVAMKNQDIIGKASTGSGKTLAYGLPILERFLLRVKENGSKPLDAPIGIVFTPTRELAKQVHSHLQAVVSNYPIKQSKNLVVSITGGLSIQKQERLLSYSPGIIVATPGRLLELIELDNNDILNKIASIEMLVLDEADRLFQDGHFDEFAKIIEILTKIRRELNKKGKNMGQWQTLVFSATFSKSLFSKLDKNVKKTKKNVKNKKDKQAKHKPDEEDEILDNNEEIVEFLKSNIRFKDSKPHVVNINPKEAVSGLVSEALIECDATNRDLYLYYFLVMYSGTTLVFTNSIDSVKRLTAFLRSLKITTYSIHSSMIQRQRLKNLENFQKATKSKTSENVVLIATDVAARGLDIPNIQHVVHYHLPRTADLYIHRSGRTGRAGQEGVSIMLCSPQEASGPLRRLRKLLIEQSLKNGSTEVEKLLNLQDDVKLLPIEVSIFEQLKERAEVATKLAEAEVMGNSISKEDSWVNKVAKDLGVDDLSDFEDDILRKNRNKKVNKSLDKSEMKNLKSQLNHLLQKKLRVGGSRKYLSNGLVNMADVMLHNKGHQSIIGYNTVNVLDVIKKSRTHQDRLNKLSEQKAASMEQKKERKKLKKNKKDDKKRKRDEKEEQDNPETEFQDDSEFSDDD